MRILRAGIGLSLLTGLIQTALAVLVLLLTPLNVTWRLYLLMAAPFLTIIAAPFHTIIVTAAFRTWCDEDVPLGDSLQLGWRRILPVLGILALMLVAAILALFVALLPGWTLRAALRFAEPDSFAPLILSAGIFLVAAATGFVKTSAAIPACVVDGLGPIASLRRSFHLTKGNFWKILAAFLTIPLGYLVFLTSLIAIGRLIDTILSDPSQTSAMPSPVFVVYVALASLALLLFLWLVAAFFTILGTVIYANLRIDSGNLTTDRIADVFD